MRDAAPSPPDPPSFPDAVPPGRFIEAYREGGWAPWDIGRPQPVFVALQAAGRIGASVLDVGCGTGDNALFLAESGHEVWGLDFVEDALARARPKAAAKGLRARFVEGDALDLGRLGRLFDAVIDCGCFHCFGDDDRPRYAEGVAAVLRPGGALHLLCFSEHEDRAGPRRVRKHEIRDTFAPWFRVTSIEEARFESRMHEGGARAWLASLTRAV